LGLRGGRGTGLPAICGGEVHRDEADEAEDREIDEHPRQRGMDLAREDTQERTDLNHETPSPDFSRV
jgi:hypothetical protein